jgi:glutamine---fructose-6-phosphate transaminase (isomerizing)
MCGIIAIARRPGQRAATDPESVRRSMDAAAAAVAGLTGQVTAAALTAVAEPLEAADALLHGPAGITALLEVAGLADEVAAQSRKIAGVLDVLETQLDEGDLEPREGFEAVNAAVIRVKDALWAVERDRLGAAEVVAELAGPEAGPAAVAALTSVQQALSALDRLEVRGRDSAGLQVMVRDHGLDLTAPGVQSWLVERADPLFRSRAVAAPGGHLVFVYKAAAEIGELGDNTAALRDAIREDALLHQALAAPAAHATVLGHTRWASVGIISEANAHPLDSTEHLLDGAGGAAVGGNGSGPPPPWVAAVLNGDVDNFADLKGLEGLGIAPEITTDAKIIPALMARRLTEGDDSTEAFRHTVAGLEGSVAIAAQCADEPDRLFLALRGSGQALYVGLVDDAFVVASEPYGLVEETPRYLRLDGETPGNGDNPTASRGQIVTLDATRAGTVDGIRRVAYDGTELAVHESDLTTAEITTRDIDRGDAPHFLLKEISESPASFRKTLRGRLLDHGDGALRVELGDDTLPPTLRARLADGSMNRVIVIGQGTAHVAGMSLSTVLSDLAPGRLRVEAVPATELSGFELRSDMSDTLVVAISQSGTTTDTNRTVDLARGRGAAVVAIVNRRGSDLTDKADGVLYTSDGRDVEMSVASTKAFYAQVAAGFLLSFAIVDELDVDVADRDHWLRALRDLPAAMERTLALRPQLAEAARLAAGRRYWAVVGNGANVVAAREIRIKLSELCYKSIACDITEDKKHIDLSAEPFILVCAAGMGGSNADDVAKEVAIYRAHKALPVVIASEGEHRYAAALHAVAVPAVHPRLDFVLSTMAGHLFGYEAALAIDAQALPLREARAAIESEVDAGRASQEALDDLQGPFEPLATRFFDGLRTGEYDGNLEASTAVRLASLFRFALGHVPLDSYQVEYGKVGTPGVLIEDLTAALTRGIEELTRPVDAIKHQAKTVTVGISRTDETLLQVPLVGEVIAAGTPRDRLSYESLRTLADLDAVVAEVLGYTRYRVEGDIEHGTATAVVLDQGGIARELPSRTERSPALRGTKNRVAAERRLLVARGRADNRSIIIVPEVKDRHTTGLALLHVHFAEQPSLAAVRGALQGYRNRYSALRDAVCETEPTFREDLLSDLPVVRLLADSIYELADHWRSS